ncbi:MAG: Valine--tRNA ligase, mitochondrial [Chaenotheca gracillima]|nr:MAG: Valine--tRNA ligase, mitochondrial [Chaenotheca gracillima]
MDDNLSAAVTETFVRLHDEGIIYRANRLVNWCTQLNTAISNLEVDNKELEGRTLLDVPGYERKVEFGVITHFKYPIEGTNETIEVATTRPETMLGDSGIAVNPKDERYKHLLGKNAKHPFVDRLLPIFADDYVDKEFGTGAVKITPAHDPNDFNLGRRHNLAFINILNDNGTMNGNTGKFEGTKRFDARYSVVKALEELGLYVKKENNPMKVPLCSRSKDVIEPVMKPQWWMRMRELADAAIKVVKDGEIIIRPESAERDYYRWLGDIQDWCISRQLWWGHRAPVYLIHFEGEQSDDGDDKSWVAGRTEQEAEEKTKAKYPGKKFKLTRDEDVLDTWFSSGLWPFSTLGWPNKTHDFEKLYPTSVLETGWDILFFWVARMIMLGVKMTGQVPFREVYCHSLVRDSEGRKMSKSLGNVIDPQDVITGIPLQGLHDKLLLGNLDPKELNNATKFQKTSFPDGIPQCGSDAVRFSLVSYTTGGGDINFDVRVIYGYRKFCNKIYQATKYVLGKIDQDFVPQKNAGRTGKESLSERWILHKFTIAAKEVNQALADREFQKSTVIVYQYWYNQLCDVYIENSKAIIQDGTEEEARSAKDTLYTALEGALTMIHPFMPFLTEELWQRLPRRPDDSTPSIVRAAYPEYDASLDDPASEAAYELVLGASKGVRSLMAEYSIRDEGKLFIQTYDQTSYETAKAQLQSIKSLCGKGVGSIDVLSKDDEKPTGCVVFAVSSSAAVFLHVKGRVDIDAEITKAKSKLQKASEIATRQQKILNDPAYQQKASQELQEQERKKLADSEAEMRNYEESIHQFETLKLE